MALVYRNNQNIQLQKSIELLIIMIEHLLHMHHAHMFHLVRVCTNSKLLEISMI